MKKMGFMAGFVTAGVAGLATYIMMNKDTSKKAKTLINDMLTETDKMIKNCDNSKIKHNMTK